MPFANLKDTTVNLKDNANPLLLHNIRADICSAYGRKKYITYRLNCNDVSLIFNDNAAIISRPVISTLHHAIKILPYLIKRYAHR